VDKVNPCGYKVRMTAVDANRARIIVLPDDIDFYGIEPDKLEVAKAVRMSTSVPFAFKPVILEKKVYGKVKKYNIVDGGVFDNLPFWLIGNSSRIPLICFSLDGETPKKAFSFDPLSILKCLISAVHDIGIPHNAAKPQNLIKIDTSKVSLLDFNLTEEEKDYLYNSGKNSAEKFLKSFKYESKRRPNLFVRIIYFLLGNRRF
jgi:NTE family protein